MHTLRHTHIYMWSALKQCHGHHYGITRNEKCAHIFTILCRTNYMYIYTYMCIYYIYNYTYIRTDIFSTMLKYVREDLIRLCVMGGCSSAHKLLLNTHTCYEY